MGRTSGGGRESNFFIQTFSTSCCGTVHLDVYNPAIAKTPHTTGPSATSAHLLLDGDVLSPKDTMCIGSSESEG